MAASVSRLTQSQYFSPVFNTAVFDGPVRIYFAQKQEAYALEVYFKISSRLRSIFGDGLNRKGPSVFVMIHPESEGFEENFTKEKGKSFCMRRLEKDHVIGVNGTLSETELKDLIEEVVQIYESALPLSAAESEGDELSLL